MDNESLWPRARCHCATVCRSARTKDVLIKYIKECKKPREVDPGAHAAQINLMYSVSNDLATSCRSSVENGTRIHLLNAKKP